MTERVVLRFEAGIAALGPDLTCMAPVRDHATTRDKAIAFHEAKDLPVATTEKPPYSIDAVAVRRDLA